LSLVSAQHHANAKENPYAQFRNEISPDAVSTSAPVADPLRLLDCSPISDGAAACILSTRSNFSGQAKHSSPVRIAASALRNDTLSLTDREEITSFSATRDAVEDALQEAEVSRDDISCIELHDCFSIAAVINVEDLGFAEVGEGIRFYEDCAGTSVGAQHAVLLQAPAINPSGGLKACGHPVGATGVKQVIDTAKYLQSNKKRWGMAHNLGGIGATASVHILENSS